MREATSVNGVWAGALMATLAAAGVREVVVSPGSRSTPLALAAQRADALTVRMAIDERSAGFFALGVARGSDAPVALVCTSGTAAANYHPAVIEASLSRVPLIVVTADRPPRLRGLGAPQTIDQTHLYGHAVRRFAELPVPTADAKALRGMAAQVALALAAAVGAPAGPVHLNVPFDEPMAPGEDRDAEADSLIDAWRGAPRVAPGRVSADHAALEAVAERMAASRRPVMIAGPDAARGGAGPALLAWAAAAGMPVVADIGADLRGEDPRGATVASAAEGFLRTSAWAAEPPDLVIRLGAAPTGRGVLNWVSRHAAPTIALQPDGEGRDHEALADLTVIGDVAEMARVLAERPSGADPRWLARWRAAEASAREAIAEGPIPLEAVMLRAAVAGVPAGGNLCLSNSLPIRHADAYLTPGPQGLRVTTFRGANGIDGVTSASLGVAAGSGRPTLLVTGDLAFMHDMGGLHLARHLETPVVVLVINNDGGGIFSYLPIAQATPHFEALFGTPHGLSFAPAAALFGLPYTHAAGEAEVGAAVARGLSTPGLSIVEVPTHRAETAAEHKAFVARLEARSGEVHA
jgi:2-succinyl-5-enolpyruvyl-6-hydroxy-3-cyclohexene-1-carboxylate synthase